MMSGADVVQLTTSLLLGGYGLVPQIFSGLEEFCRGKGITGLEGVVGSALGGIQEYAKLAQREPVNLRNRELCLECPDKPCQGACFFDALEMSASGWPLIDPVCNGCGLCVQMCPDDGALQF
jgi:dihydropyrimidine dehydrogenase (NAD+) subunit PreA